MIKIEYKDGLLFTSLEIFFRGSSLVIDNIVIDTGAAETIISLMLLRRSVFLQNLRTMYITESAAACTTFSPNRLTE